MISADCRDRAPANIPALDPDWVLKMRAYFDYYKKTGIIHWVKRGKDWNK